MTVGRMSSARVSVSVYLTISIIMGKLTPYEFCLRTTELGKWAELLYAL